MYAAHVTDFAGRCEAVSAWFFQCPEPLDVRRRAIQFILLFLNNNDNNTGSGSRTLRCKGEKHVTSRMLETWECGIGVLGVPVSMLERNTRDALSGNAKDYFIDIPKRIWRDTTAAYPSKFAWQKNVNTARFEMIPDHAIFTQTESTITTRYEYALETIGFRTP